MSDVADWLEKAARCRRLAVTATDAKTRETLAALIVEYENEAARARAGTRARSAMAEPSLQPGYSQDL